MINIYQAWYICKAIEPSGLPGYNSVRLGIPGDELRTSDLIVHGTCSRFVVGREYYISIAERE